MLLRARWVFPISSPPIENGAVIVENDRILFVGAQLIAPLHKPILDLGDSTLLPGLVNAHCHLEFSRRGQKGIFTEWVREMVRVGASRRDAPTEGIQRLLQTGTTTVADHCSPEVPAFETPFRRIPFWEVLGADRERAESSLQKARDRSASEGGHVTPHSLYAVHEDILGKISSSLQSIHLLESADEDEFFRRGSGPLADYVIKRDGKIPLPGVGTRFIAPGRSELRPYTNLLLIHGNYLNPQEIGFLRDMNASVIHCPGSHRFFGHKRFPYEELRATDVRVALGTDSLASNEDLSMLREMRLFRETYPNVGIDEILRMATIEGARALRMDDQVGSLDVGKKADLIAVAGPSSLKDVLKADQVVFSMIDGKICINPSNNSSPS